MKYKSTKFSLRTVQNEWDSRVVRWGEEEEDWRRKGSYPSSIRSILNQCAVESTKWIRQWHVLCDGTRVSHSIKKLFMTNILVHLTKLVLLCLLAQHFLAEHSLQIILIPHPFSYLELWSAGPKHRDCPQTFYLKRIIMKRCRLPKYIHTVDLRDAWLKVQKMDKCETLQIDTSLIIPIQKKTRSLAKHSVHLTHFDAVTLSSKFFDISIATNSHSRSTFLLVLIFFEWDSHSIL